ncbi:hypothetical protein [Dehalococcoides mccartyi]|jgi:hypothetical protein|uniref:hypothetical protein n=1 Tax=Dehalococcoides mccartyi TaxID=61435 RepID=UPI00030C0294|nr:hypothetical protein [Dehalococcoides mccartyi]
MFIKLPSIAPKMKKKIIQLISMKYIVAFFGRTVKRVYIRKYWRDIYKWAQGVL